MHDARNFKKQAPREWKMDNSLLAVRGINHKYIVVAKEIVEMKCYQALEEIKGILENDGLEDKECFEK